MKDSFTAEEERSLNREQQNFTNGRFGKDLITIQHYSDNDLQNYLLLGVSRTFALTIPQLPPELSEVVTNAYLLCRIVDTIEDEPALSSEEKRAFCERFIRVVAGSEDPSLFGDDLFTRLSSASNHDEHLLIKVTDRVISITHSFDIKQRNALERCVRIMSDGMAYFQENASANGLKDMSEMNNYCYYVAGVVGEMLTELFCIYSPEIAKHKEKLMSLAVSFGQGLQMTNILKDVWDDQDRSACWLPRNLFEEKGFDLELLQKGHTDKAFQTGLDELVGVAHMHLDKAMEYTLTIPSEETGIRKFCLWAVGMAILTLQNIHRNLDFTDSNKVKISRKSVKATITTTNLFVKNNLLLKFIFNIIRTGLPYRDSVE